LCVELESLRTGALRVFFTRPAGYLILLAGLVMTFAYLLQMPLTQKNVRVPVMMLTVFPVFLFFVINKIHPNKLIGWSPAQLMGKISYSFYLWHLSVNFYVITLVNRIIKDPQALLSFGPTCAVMMFIGLTISVFSYKYVEEYFLKKSHRKVVQ